MLKPIDKIPEILLTSNPDPTPSADKKSDQNERIQAIHAEIMERIQTIPAEIYVECGYEFIQMHDLANHNTLVPIFDCDEKVYEASKKPL